MLPLQRECSNTNPREAHQRRPPLVLTSEFGSTLAARSDGSSYSLPPFGVAHGRQSIASQQAAAWIAAPSSQSVAFVASGVAFVGGGKRGEGGEARRAGGFALL